jgi:HPt (histidine-containing phosphotransfer) domain-containing protein
MSARVELDCIAELGERDFVHEMVDLFATAGADQIRDVRSALGRGDAVGLARCAHKLRGACVGMFATTMAELAQNLEQGAKGARLEQASGVLSKLEVAMHETIAQMRTLRAHP